MASKTLNGLALQGRVIAITGAASGIGRATARECAVRGAKLALSDTSSEPLNDLVEELRKNFDIDVTGTQVNVTNSGAVDTWIATTIEHFGRLDGAVNAAGIESKGEENGGVITTITDTNDEGWNRIINTNLTGTFYCLRAELRVMTAGASVVNISSVAGLIGRPGISAYSTSKHGVVGLTRSAAREVGKDGVRVNAVAPGPIMTPMLQRIIDLQDQSLTDSYADIPLQRVGQPEEVARTICFLLSNDSAFTTGTIMPIDGGFFC